MRLQITPLDVPDWLWWPFDEMPKVPDVQRMVLEVARVQNGVDNLPHQIESYAVIVISSLSRLRSIVPSKKGARAVYFFSDIIVTYSSGEVKLGEFGVRLWESPDKYEVWITAYDGNGRRAIVGDSLSDWDVI